MAIREFPSLDLIRQSLREENGHLFWLTRPEHHFTNKRDWNGWNSRFAGKEAGWIQKHGRHLRCNIGFNGKRIFRYVIVWSIHHGEWPTLEIDHENRDSLDDRIGNLRLAARNQNISNSRMYSNNTSGFKGVSWNKRRQKWEARIRSHPKRIHLGQFDDPHEAHEARMEAARKLHGEFATDGT